MERRENWVTPCSNVLAFGRRIVLAKTCQTTLGRRTPYQAPNTFFRNGAPMSIEKVARALCHLDGLSPDEITVKAEDTKDGVPLYRWQRYASEAAHQLELINTQRGKAILEAAGWQLAR
jgi:hypothetical protein